MARRRHYPPSQIRYWREHPVVGVRLSRELKELLDRVRGGRSYAELIKDVLMRTFDSHEKGYWEGFEDGARSVLEGDLFNLGEDELSRYGLEYPRCIYCGKPLYGVVVDKNDNMGKWVLEKIAEAGWHHKRCARQGRENQ